MHGDDAMLFRDDECRLGRIGGISALRTTWPGVATGAGTLRTSRTWFTGRAGITRRAGRTGKLQAIAAWITRLVTWITRLITWIAFVSFVADDIAVLAAISGGEIATLAFGATRSGWAW